MPLIAVLVALDVTVSSVSRWFDAHDFTTSVLTGILVLLVTVLVINRVLRLRQLRDRAQVTAAQAVIIAAQAYRAQQAAGAAAGDVGARDSAVDELRTYLTMLLISAPVLIDAPRSRVFLERAQRLAALLSTAVRASADGPIPRELAARLTDAVDGLHDALAPLVALLPADQQAAVRRVQATGAAVDADSEDVDPDRTDPGADPSAR